MANPIKVDYESKTRRLVFNAPFHYVDVIRALPSRRFDPKTKLWRAPLIRQNVAYIEDQMRGRFDMEFTPAAEQAIIDLEVLTAKPVYLPFPTKHLESRRQPLPHQWPMLDYGWNLKAYALFARMGTGKTFVTVNVAHARYAEGQINAVIVICPMTLRHTWVREFEKWAPGLAEPRFLDSGDSQYLRWCSEPSKKLKALLVSVEGLGISQKLPIMAQHFMDTHKALAVCDESSRIKNPDANRTKVVIDLGGRAAYRMALNGTPTAKGIQDLWAQFEFLDPNIIGSGDYWAFKTRYLVMGGFENRQIIGYSNVDELMDLIRPYTLEVGKEVLNLPPKIPKTIYLQATTEQQRLFERILTGITESDEPMIKAQNVLERMLRMQQVVGGFEPVTDPDTMITSVVPLLKNPKMDALLSMIEDNYDGSKFIIWARYVPEILAIKAALVEKYGADAVVDYYGATPPDQRSVNEDRYCRDPKCRFFVGNPAAAGLGLTLISNESDVMVYYSGTFAYIDRAQSEDRAHRIGQTRTVAVVDFVIEGSIDQVIQRSIAEKTDLDVFVKEQIAKGHQATELLRGCVRTLDTREPA